MNGLSLILKKSQFALIFTGPKDQKHEKLRPDILTILAHTRCISGHRFCSNLLEFYFVGISINNSWSGATFPARADWTCICDDTWNVRSRLLRRAFSLYLLQDNQTMFLQTCRTIPPTFMVWFKCHISISTIFLWSFPVPPLRRSYRQSWSYCIVFICFFMTQMATVGLGIWCVPLFSGVYHLLLAFSKKLWPFPHSRSTTWGWPLVRRWLKTLLWSLFSKVMPWNTSGIIHIAATANSPHTRKKKKKNKKNWQDEVGMRSRIKAPGCTPRVKKPSN